MQSLYKSYKCKKFEIIRKRKLYTKKVKKIITVPFKKITIYEYYVKLTL